MTTTYASYQTQPQTTRHPHTPVEPLQITWESTTHLATSRPNPHPRTAQIPTNGLPAEKVLCLEIEKLCDTTLVIDQAFYDIGRRLSDASREQNKRADLYNMCCDLETRWKQLHLTYKNLIWRSREFAGEAQGAVDDFYKHVLPFLKDSRRSVSEKQSIIQAQIQVIQNKSQPSQNLSQNFIDFGRTLDTYIADFSRYAEGFDTAEQSTKVDGLKDKLQKSRVAMEALRKEVREIGWKLAADATVAGIALLLAVLAPSFWERLPTVQTLGLYGMNARKSLVQYLDTRRRCNLAVAAHEETKDNYEQESACLDQMVKLESTLQDARPLVDEVMEKLGIFASVWATIWSDMGKLKRSLQYADDPASPLFIMRVETLEELYRYLSRALRHYQVTVQLPRRE